MHLERDRDNKECPAGGREEDNAIIYRPLNFNEFLFSNEGHCPFDIFVKTPVVHNGVSTAQEAPIPGNIHWAGRNLLFN